MNEWTKEEVYTFVKEQFSEETAEKVGVVRLVQSNHGTQQEKLGSLLFCCRTKHKRIIIKVHGSECIARTVAGLRPE